MMQGALPEVTADRGHTVTIAQPGVAFGRHGVEEEGTVACPPPRDHVDIDTLLIPDGLANCKETVIEDVVDFLRWRHSDLDEGVKEPSIGERRDSSPCTGDRADQLACGKRWP